MKKIVVLLILCFSAVSLQAQSSKDKEGHREQIKALKVAYITQELNMDTQLAQQFWPIYNRYEDRKMQLHKREHVELPAMESVSEAKAEEMLKEYLTIEREEYVIKKELFAELKKILSAKEIIKLHQLESDFNKKLLKEYRQRKNAGNDKK